MFWFATFKTLLDNIQNKNRDEDDNTSMGISLKNKTLISVEIDARKVLETSFLNDYESFVGSCCDIGN